MRALVFSDGDMICCVNSVSVATKAVTGKFCRELMVRKKWDPAVTGLVDSINTRTLTIEPVERVRLSQRSQ